MSCEGTKLDDDMNDEYELPRDCDFLSVGVNFATRSECSPVLRGGITSKFQGIVINGPEKIVWPRDVDTTGMMVSPLGEIIGSPLKFIISGVARLPSNTLGLNGIFGYDVVVVAVNQETAQVYTGKMIRFGFKPDGAGENKTGAVKSYFNVDLVHNLGVPIADGTYIVYATLADYKSNVLMIKTQVK